MRNQLFDFSVNVLQALLWRNNKAARLTSLLQSKQSWYDENQRDFWAGWLRDVFDLRTANAFGCAVWAIILGIPLAVINAGSTRPTWGFGAFHRNFERGNFAPLGQNIIPLTLPQKRLVLQLRYLQLITRATVPEINRQVQRIFTNAGLGQVYVLDGLNMTANYVFTFALPAGLDYVLRNYDILPRPAAVLINFVITTRPTWGFGAFHRNFNRGTFGA